MRQYSLAVLWIPGPREGGPRSLRWLLQQVSQERRGPTGRPLLLDDQLSGPDTEGACIRSVGQALLNKVMQLLPIADDHRGLFCKEQLDNVPEIPGIGSEAGGDAIGTRLDHILTTPFSKTPSDKTDVCHSPPRTELSDDVYEKHRRGIDDRVHL